MTHFISTLYVLFWTQASWPHTAWLMEPAKCLSCLVMDCSFSLQCVVSIVVKIFLVWLKSSLAVLCG